MSGMRRARRTVLAGLMAIAVVLSVAPLASAEHYEDTVELQGATPVEAAVSFSKLAFPSGAPQAALGRDDNFADSLASGVLQANAPLLLTPTAALAPAVESELKRLGAETVHILGGTSAISPAVEAKLVADGYTVRRHRGPTRIDTAVEIARAIAPSASRVLIARAFAGGEDPTQAFADSLGAGAWSASTGDPVLLTESDKLSAATQAYLETNKPLRAFVIGGTSAISDEVLAQIAALGITAERVSGPTRFDTAVEIAKKRGIADAGDTNDIVLMEGQAAGSWAPGFAGAAYAAAERAAVLLASGTTLPAPTLAFLDQGAATLSLLCAPQLAAEACDAAAETLDKQLAPQVTLNEATVAQYSNVTGTILPAEEVLSATATGCGLNARQVIVNQDGTFATRIEGAPGTCELKFDVKTRTRGDFTKTFPLTVTEPAPATGAPELVKAEVSASGATFATVRYVFSEVVRATGVRGTPTGDFDNTKFLLYGARGVTAATGEPFVASDGGASSVGSAPRRDPDNPRAMLADFVRADFDLATTAAVMTGATEDVNYDVGDPANLSLPGSAPLKPVQLPGARTDGLDLVTVGGVSAQGMAPGEFRADFTFDGDPTELVTTAGPEAFGVVLADGRLIVAKSVAAAGDGVSARAVFAVADTRTPEGATCAEGQCPTLQEALSGTRRGYVARTDHPLQAVAVTGDGLTTRADLTGVTVDIANGTADFTFDAAVSSADVSKLTLYLVTGDKLALSEATVASSTVVRVKAAVSKLVVGASAGAGAVLGSAGQSPPAAVGLAQDFAAGEMIGPRLDSATAAFLGAGTANPDDKKWKITFVFDQVIEMSTGAFMLYVSTGKPYASDDPDNVLTACATVETEKPKTVACEVDLLSDEVPAVASVERGAVQADGAVPGSKMDNIERSVRL